MGDWVLHRVQLVAWVYRFIVCPTPAFGCIADVGQVKHARPTDLSLGAVA